MKLKFWVFFAVILLVRCTPAYSQSNSGTGSQSTSGNPLSTPGNGSQSDPWDGSPDLQQGSSVNCANGLNATGEGCIQSQQEAPRGVTGMENRRTSVAGASENAGLNGQTKTRTQQDSTLLPPEPLTEFQRFVAATTGQVLPIYGASLFRNVPSTFAPIDLAPVTSEYVIGPDDELRIRIWGQINYTGNLRVDRSGNIYLPEVGSIHVAGLQFSALDQHLRSAAARIYRNFDLSVDIGRIRSMQIYVTGQARRPGVYTVSSLSTLVDALFASGGPSPQGSLRHIQLHRAGKTIADFDLYALLIHGDKSNDAQLLPEDVLYIPATGAEVAITGSVRVPGIYELRGDETVGNLIDAAGKTNGVASGARISIERVAEHQLREAMEVGSDTAGLAVPLADGDILRIYSILPAYQKTVTLRGNVANPGHFSWHPGMHLRDLIPDRDSLVSRDYWWKRSHLGLPSPEFEPLISTIGQDPYKPEVNRQGFTTAVTQETLSAALTRDERQDPNRAKADPADSEDRGSTGGTLASPLRKRSSPGEATTKKQTEVRIAAPEIDWNFAVIERLDPETLKTSLLSFDLGKLILKHDQSQDLELQPGDTVSVFSQADIRVPLEQQTKYVTLEGEFVHAGTYSAAPGETLRDLVRRAGGLSSMAYLYGSEFDRESTRTLQQQRIDENVRRVSLEAERGALALASSATSSATTVATAAGARATEQELIASLKLIRATGRIVLKISPDSNDLADLPAIGLEDGDHFTIPPTPATINVVGAVYDQNSFLYEREGTVGSYLQMAGGPDRDADRGHTFVVRADGSVVERTTMGSPFGNTFKNLRLHPGDTILVPDKTLRPTALRGLLDFTQIISQLALTAASVNILLR